MTQLLTFTHGMSERVMPFKVQPPLQFLSGWQLVILRELQLFFLEQQIKYLFYFGHIEVEAFHKPLLFDPLARDGVCPPSPLYHGHFLLLARIIGITSLGHVNMALEFFLV